MLDDKKIFKIWDVHDNFPEKYHEAMNFHTEMVVEKIEKDLFDKSDLIISDNEKVLNNLRSKYQNSNKFLLVKDNNTDLIEHIKG